MQRFIHRFSQMAMSRRDGRPRWCKSSTAAASSGRGEGTWVGRAATCQNIKHALIPHPFSHYWHFAPCATLRKSQQKGENIKYRPSGVVPIHRFIVSGGESTVVNWIELHRHTQARTAMNERSVPFCAWGNAFFVHAHGARHPIRRKARRRPQKVYFYSQA